MNFLNYKKTFLRKKDKSKKGRKDKKILLLVKLFNNQKDYFTTSSCSGRVVLWRGSGKKNEFIRLKESHQLIKEEFLKRKGKKKEGIVWLRVEPFILHVCCRDLETAKRLLIDAKLFFKKSNLLTFSNKIIVEIKGSEFIELPLFNEGELFIKEKVLKKLVELINQKLKQNWQKTKLFYNFMKKKLEEEKLKK